MAEILRTKHFKSGGKTFHLDFRENRKGRFVQIVEIKPAGGHQPDNVSRVMIPSDLIADVSRELDAILALPA